jgi:hypothetical protein
MTAQPFKKRLELYCIPLYDEWGVYIGDAYIEESTRIALTSTAGEVRFKCERAGVDTNQLELPMDHNAPLKLN